MVKSKKPGLPEELGLTGIRIRIRKLEKIKQQRYEDLNPEQLQALQILRTEEHSLLLRKSQGENVDEELARLQQAPELNVDEQLEELYKLEKIEMKKEAEKDAEIARRMKNGDNLLVPE